jgi:hypothetical protein
MGYVISLATREQLLEVVLVVYREENIAVGHMIRLATLEQLLWLVRWENTMGYVISLATMEQLLEVVLVVYREENIAGGRMIRLPTLKQLLWVVILGWKDSPDDAMILVGDPCKFINWMRTITTEIWWILALWWRNAFGTRST